MKVQIYYCYEKSENFQAPFIDSLKINSKTRSSFVPLKSRFVNKNLILHPKIPICK